MGARLIPLDTDRHQIILNHGRVTIGSTDNNSVILANHTISRRHAIIENAQDSYVISDAGSTNGTFVNGKRISTATRLCHGDTLRLGALKFVFQIDCASDSRQGVISSGRSWIWTIGLLILIGLSGAAATTLFWSTSSRVERPGLAGKAIPASPAASPITDTASLPPPDEDAGPHPWLVALNRYRTMVGEAAVRSNSRLSSGAALHSRYIAENYGDQIRHGASLGAAMHQEDSSKPGYTSAGAATGLAGDVDAMWDPRATHPDSWAIDNWMVAPFHRLSLLDPRLRSVGYGDYCAAGVCIATLNARSDIAPATSPKETATPVEYPPNGADVEAVGPAAEWPNPLTSCAGFVSPVGLPITLQLGRFAIPIVTQYALTLDQDPSVTIEACAIDANTYANPDAATQSIGRELLHEYGAVIIVPRKSLAPGRYDVGMKASGTDYKWSFTVKP